MLEGIEADRPFSRQGDNLGERVMNNCLVGKVQEGKGMKGRKELAVGQLTGEVGQGRRSHR